MHVIALNCDSNRKLTWKALKEGFNYFADKIQQVLPQLRRSKKSEQLAILEPTQDDEENNAIANEKIPIIIPAVQQTHAEETDVSMRALDVAVDSEHSETTKQDGAAKQLVTRKLLDEPEESKLNVDVRNFRTPYVIRESEYWFIIFKGTIASLCIALNIIHLFHFIGLFPPSFSLLKLKATNYDYAIALATSNINKLFLNRVGLVVRSMPYTEKSEFEIYSNCKVLINNYQWSEWIEFEKQTDQQCGTSTYLRYYNLRIVKVIGNMEKITLPTRCPATVQYKRTWQRACCPQNNNLQPFENYVNLTYDKAFCIVKSTLRSVNASKLSDVCTSGKLWTPLPMAAFPVNNSYYQRSDIVKSYEIQRGEILKNYWIGVERTNGKNWLMNGRLINFDSQLNCQNHCYNMKVLLSSDAYVKYLKKKKYFVCVRNEKWELFSSDESHECMAICVMEANSN